MAGLDHHAGLNMPDPKGDGTSSSVHGIRCTTSSGKGSAQETSPLAKDFTKDGRHALAPEPKEHACSSDAVGRVIPSTGKILPAREEKLERKKLIPQGRTFWTSAC